MNILVSLRNLLWPKPYPSPQSNYQSLSINDKSKLDSSKPRTSMEDLDNLIDDTLDLLNRMEYFKYVLRSKIENGSGNGAK
jgi:hypothetical protein